jgi:two-component system sensor histidine kinase/response regulator
MDTNNPDHRRRNIVIVDDNAELSWFFQEILKLHGYEATVFNHPVPALKHVLTQHTDAIICDLQMPGLDGDLFYATVERAQPVLAQRFIFVTGVADDERFQTFINTVEVPVLRKPVAVEKLLEEIARIVR